MTRFVAAGLAALLAGCALKVQEPLAAPAQFTGPSLGADHVVSFDGARLGLQSWLPPGEAEPWAVVVAVHGMSEYGEAFYLVGPWLAARGVAVYAYDQRGFGRSPQRGLWPGTELMARDLIAVRDAARTRHPDATLAVLGQSMGAATVMTATVQADGPLADRVILSAPGVRGWSALPWAYRLSLAVAARVAGGRAVRPPRGVSVQATDNIEALIKNGEDPLFLHDTRLDALHGLISHMEAAAQAAPGRRAPTLFLYGAKDELIPPRAAEVAAGRLGPCARSALYADGWHMLMRDLQAPVVWRDIEAFLADAEAALPSGAPPVPGAPDAGPASAAGSTLSSQCLD